MGVTEKLELMWTILEVAMNICFETEVYQGSQVTVLYRATRLHEKVSIHPFWRNHFLVPVPLFGACGNFLHQKG